MAIDILPQSIRTNYDVTEYRHALAILKEDYPAELNDLVTILSGFKLKKSYIDIPGGSKSLVASTLDSEFEAKGWIEKKFDTSINVDNVTYSSPTHKVDCYKNKIALELEWNNKDPFFDRDLNNFRLLFELRAISVGIIITRTDGLQNVFNQIGRGKSYGNSTTHLSKLLPRIMGGGGGGCPLLVFGITPRLYDPNS